MKKFFLPLMLLLSMFTASITSCSGDSDENDWNISEDSINVIFEKVGQVAQVAGDVFDRCNTIEDVDEYIDELRNTKDVEDVWTDSHTLFVKIKDFGTIKYLFTPNVREITNEDEDFLSTRANIQKLPHTHLETPKIAIANQLLYDEQGIGTQAREYANKTKMMFKACDYDAKIVEPTIDFFQKGMYEYDIIFLITHGGYDPYEQSHWLLTTDKCDRNDQWGFVKWLGRVLEVYGIQYKSFPEDEVSIFSVKEKHNGKTIEHVYYPAVSEKLISGSGNRFDESKTPIIFNGACDSYKGNDKMAQTFISLGAKSYYGYDESNGVGPMAGYEFFKYLLMGSTQLASYNHISDEYRNDKDGDIVAHLKKKYAHDDYETSCIVHPSLICQNIEEAKTGDFVTLKARFNGYLPQTSNFVYGFILSETDNPNESSNMFDFKIGDKGCSIKNGVVEFEKNINIRDVKPETNYKCWAYVNEWGGVCLSDMGTFTSPEKPTIDQVIPDDIRKTMEPYITIYDGNNPPNIEGTYVIDPMEIVYDMTGGYQPGYKKFGIIYFEISNQNSTTNTLDYREQEVSNGVMVSESKGDGAFISGEGNNFSVYFNTTGVTHLDTYDVTSTHALVISGTKTNDGIRDLRYSFVMVDKGDDPEEMIINKGDFRVFKDGDDWAEKTHWSFTRSPQITVRDGQIITPWKVTKRKQIH